MKDGSRPPDLEPQHVVRLATRLADRVRERFPQATLGRTAARLVAVTEASAARAASIRRPIAALRIAILMLVAAIPGSLAYALWSLGVHIEVHSLSGYVSLFQSTVESLIFIGAGIAFLVTLETRLKRGRALHALHELRVLAHLVDMHQLDKDPIYLLARGERTASSPARSMSPFELNRYLDYCSELLSLIGKVAALYGQNLHDPVTLGAIDALESLTNGLSRKIWQKASLLDRALGA